MALARQIPPSRVLKRHSDFKAVRDAATGMTRNTSVADGQRKEKPWSWLERLKWHTILSPRLPCGRQQHDADSGGHSIPQFYGACKPQRPGVGYHPISCVPMEAGSVNQPAMGRDALETV